MTNPPERHASSTRIYWLIGAGLAVVTAMEVAIAYLGLPELAKIVLLLLLSLVKGAMVVMFFMHLKGDARVFKFVFIVPILMALAVVVTFLLLFSGHVGIAG